MFLICLVFIHVVQFLGLNFPLHGHWNKYTLRADNYILFLDFIFDHLHILVQYLTRLLFSIAKSENVDNVNST